MKVSQIPIIFAILVPAIAALPEGEKPDVAANAKVDAGTLSCGAEGSCVGVGGGDLCNDRVSGPEKSHGGLHADRWRHSASNAKAPAANIPRGSAAVLAGSKCYV